MNSITASIGKIVVALSFANAVTALAGGPTCPLPQNPAKSKANDLRMLEWSRHTIQEPFEKLSKKDPKWDAQAKKFMALVTEKHSGPSEMNVSFEDLFEAGKETVDLGRDDPLLLYFFTRAAANSNSLDAATCEKQLETSAAGSAKMQYPPVRRAAAFIKTAVVKARRKDDAASIKEAKRLLAAGLNLFPESVKIDGKGPDAAQIWSDLLDDAANVW